MIVPFPLMFFTVHTHPSPEVFLRSIRKRGGSCAEGFYQVSASTLGVLATETLLIGALFVFLSLRRQFFLGQSVATTQHLNRTENSQITNQPVHIRTLAVSASSTATSAVNLSPKPIALWTSPLLSLYLCLCVYVCLRACWYREALTPNVRGEQGKTAVPADASPYFVQVTA